MTLATAIKLKDDALVLDDAIFAGAEVEVAEACSSYDDEDCILAFKH